jgi:three-Cys-motif partner protein
VGVEIPSEYEGREQTYLKRRVLRDYLVAWGQKLSSMSRSGAVRLWYVDCSAGGASEQATDMADSPSGIGICALEEAAAAWHEQGLAIRTGALFVEPDEAPFERLREFLAARSGTIAARAVHGEFADHVDKIRRRIGSDPAFLFVDPTGWRGAAIRLIAPLLGFNRDVMVDVMFGHVSRFAGDPGAFLRGQMMDFFGFTEAEVPPHLDEEALIELYRARLKQRCGLRFAADLAIPHPTRERTWYRLLVGGRSPAVLDLFRAVEQQLVRQEGATREPARRRREQRATPSAARANGVPRQEVMRSRGVAAIEGELATILSSRGPRPFVDIWPTLLEQLHVTRNDAAERILELVREGKIVASGLSEHDRTIKGAHVLSLSASP